jgi:hypothetical protein
MGRDGHLYIYIKIITGRLIDVYLESITNRLIGVYIDGITGGLIVRLYTTRRPSMYAVLQGG